MKQLGKTAAFWAAVLLVWELMFHWTTNGAITPRFLFSLGFTLAGAAALALLSHLLPWERGNRIVRYGLLLVLAVIFGAQTVYYRVFGDLASVVLVSMGGEAVGNFRAMVISGILDSLPQIAVYLLPLPVLAVLHGKGLLSAAQAPVKPLLLAAACAAGLFLAGRTAALSDAQAGLTYLDAYASVERQASYFGLATAERLDIQRFFSDGASPLAGSAGLGSEAAGLPPEMRNIMPEIDFAQLDAATDDETLLALDAYFSGLSGTAKNEYTGLFEGYNLIEICAESFSPYVLSEELTPALWRLAHEGIVFENFYNSFSSVTSNGEYSMCMGLMPDLSRLSFATSMDNYVPFTLAHRVQPLGIQALAYHNNIATFYNRINTHTNMGYDFRALGHGLDMEKGSPASDLEMMEKTVDEYIQNEPFVVHYMSYSGHAPHVRGENDMVEKNWDKVKDLDCSEEVKCYIAGELELEYAVEYLLQRLEDAGIADHTVVVLSGDHYPYGLSDEAYAELAGDRAEDPFWRYRNSFICWTGALAEPIRIDDYCCTQDILPTILNLFNIPYDSRLLTGVDVLSTGVHLALLQDGSFLTRELIYDSDSGETTYLLPEEEVPEEYAQQLLQYTRNQFSCAAAILRSDYYRFVFSTLDLADTDTAQRTEASFGDIAGTWYEAYIEAMVGRGIFSGTNNGDFQGDLPASRATFLTMLARMLYLAPAEGTVLPYTDVDENQWYYDTVSAAWSAGLLPEGDTLRPDDCITGQEAREIFTAAAVYAGVDDAERWAGEAADQALALAAENGVDAGALNRAAAAVLVSRLLDVTE